MTRPHAERNAAICQLRREGLTLAAISQRHGLTRERVRQIVTAAGIPHVRAIDRIRPLLEQGCTLDEAARRTGIPPGTAYNVASAAGIPFTTDERVRTEKQERAVLEEHRVFRLTPKETSRALGIPAHTVNYVLRKHGIRHRKVRADKGVPRKKEAE